MWARQGLKGFDRDLWLLQSEMFLSRLVMGFLEIVRPIYLFLIGFDPLAIGFIMTVGTFIDALDTLVTGTLSDRYGRKPFILMGGIFSTIRMVLYALSRDFWILVIAQGIGALGEGPGAGQAVVSGYIADKTGVKERPRIFSVIAISLALSATIGSLMAALPAYFQISLNLDEVSSHTLLFWLGALINALAIFFMLPIKETRKKRENAEDIPPSNLSWGEIGKFCLIRSTDGLGMGLVTSLVPLYFHLRFDAGSEDLALIYALARFLAIPTYLFVPLLVSRLGNVKGLIISRIVTGATIAIFATAYSFQMAAALFATYRLLFEFAMPMRQAFSTELVESHQTGRMIGTSNSARQLAHSLAPTIAGYLFEIGSFSIPFFSGAALLAINGIQYHVFYRRRQTSFATGSPS